MKLAFNQLLSGQAKPTLVLYVLVALPFFALTFDTGFFSDDYQMMLFSLKFAISPIDQNLADILEPRPDGHFMPVWKVINTMLLSLSSSPKFFHGVVVLVNFLTAFLVYRISIETLPSPKAAVMAGVLYLCSFGLTHKALTWNVFHSHVTNSFTGALALLALIFFLNSDRTRYLLGTLIFLVLTVFNSESGFVFIVALGIFATLQLAYRKISPARFLKAAIVILTPLALYLGGMAYFSGDPIALYTKRVEQQRSVSLAENLSQDTNADQGLVINRLRSTYAPRNGIVLVMRTMDLAAKTLNLSILEDVLRGRLYDPLSLEEKSRLKEQFIPLFKFGLVIGVVVVIPLVGFVFYSISREITQDTLTFLILTIALFGVFVTIFNRVDIANALAIFSSITLANLYFTTTEKANKYICTFILSIFLGGAAIALLDRFENTFFFNKTNRQSVAQIHDQIIEKLPGYSTNVLVLVDKRSSFAHPAMSEVTPMPHMDLAHYNAFTYQKQFRDTQVAQSYMGRSYYDFADSKELKDTISSLIVLDRTAWAQYARKFDHVIYVDNDDRVKQITSVAIPKA